MKRFFALVAVATLSLGAVSCGEKTETTDVETVVDSAVFATDSVSLDSTAVETPGVAADSVENVTVDSTAATTEEVK
ncbi:hypothetical protein [Faecalibacter bovis]|uniref:Lipoprotein n=1 Tax=Faecalibacter bovis TaxID=2898187 RepID=A0ABX7XFT0_9FLAO|nr:hypothetical protein [Faecalibacter bovis]QTV06771.1 hypothetical protein J9309_05505 [Faecalibacter bovis]